MHSTAKITQTLTEQKCLGEKSKDPIVMGLVSAVAFNNITCGSQIGTERLFYIADQVITDQQEINQAIRTIDPSATTPLKTEEDEINKQLATLRNDFAEWRAKIEKVNKEILAIAQHAPIPKEAITAIPQISQHIKTSNQQTLQHNQHAKDFIESGQKTSDVKLARYKRKFGTLEDDKRNSVTPPERIAERIVRSRIESSLPTITATHPAKP